MMDLPKKMLVALALVLASPAATAATDEGGQTEAGAGVCFIAYCAGATADTTTIAQTHTCTASGSVIVVFGNNNTVKMCSENDQNATRGRVGVL